MITFSLVISVFMSFLKIPFNEWYLQLQEKFPSISYFTVKFWSNTFCWNGTALNFLCYHNSILRSLFYLGNCCKSGFSSVALLFIQKMLRKITHGGKFLILSWLLYFFQKVEDQRSNNFLDISLQYSFLMKNLKIKQQVHGFLDCLMQTLTVNIPLSL